MGALSRLVEKVIKKVVYIARLAIIAIIIIIIIMHICANDSSSGDPSDLQWACRHDEVAAILLRSDTNGYIFCSLRCEEPHPNNQWLLRNHSLFLAAVKM